MRLKAGDLICGARGRGSDSRTEAGGLFLGRYPLAQLGELERNDNDEQ